MSEADFLARIQRFAQTCLAQAAPGWALGGAPEPGLWHDAAALGLTGITTPQAHGGLGHSFDTLLKCSQALAEVDFGFAMALINTQNVGARLCLSATDTLRNRYLPGILSGKISACTALTEPGAGTDFAAITTRAEETPDGWQITGEKTWIVNGRHAGLAVVFAQCGAVGDAAGIGAFLVDLTQPTVKRYAINSGFAQETMGTGGFTLAQAPADLLLPPGTAFKSILIEINAARTYVAAMCNAMLGAALAQARAYGAERLSFGKPLDQYAEWCRPLSLAQTDLAAARALTAQAAAQISAGQDAQLAAAQAKIAATEAAQRHIPEMLHAVGAAGLLPHYCFTRHLAAAQTAGFTDGATSILRARVARLTRASTQNSTR